MRPKKHALFTLFKHHNANGTTVWYARFWDDATQRYAIARSTGVLAQGKRERHDEAITVAREMASSIQFSSSPLKQLFVDYVESFWTSSSCYVKERALVLKKPLSAYYVKMNHDDVGRHIRPFPGFRKLTLNDLTPGHIRDWMRWAAEKGLSARRINAVLQSMRVAVRYAVSREELLRDPFAKIAEVKEEIKEKGILTPAEVSLLINRNGNDDPRIYLGILLGVFCGLRRGEVRGLQWGDVDLNQRIIHVNHNYVDNEGIKTPKCKSMRSVPIPRAVYSAFNAVRTVSPYLASDDFVLFNFLSRDIPVSMNFFRAGLCSVLESIGIKKEAQKLRNITFHSLRHTFVTLGRLAGISDFEIQALAGHRSSSMMERYSHVCQVIDYGSVCKKLEDAANQ
ncbi:MAG TPA: site-specific integrase [Rectinema sp.]|jgi:integrase|nr:site-specific integrase [Spirochaetota bacterium]NLH90537.1 site-specific integrase [Treponema sp.]HNV36704.1 site-specific integrase [Rectinema sp.]HOC27861.1 site-specific integrase [Rectinema sp.]HOU06623.1 site-specific integrase [Rectinema sp.]